MNPIKARIRKQLASYPPVLAAIRDLALRYLDRCCAIEIDDSLLIAHRPWAGPQNYAIRLFPGARTGWFAKYAKLHGVRIPNVLRPLLRTTNGCFVFDFSLFGIAPSMLKDPPLLDRSRVQCLDVGRANDDWSKRFLVDREYFHFGAREEGEAELVGYFLTNARRFAAFRESGEIVGEWTTLEEFLEHEVSLVESRVDAEGPNAWWD